MCASADELLSLWQSYLKNISTNLMELSEQMEYQIISGKVRDSKNGYTGSTKVKAEHCIASMAALWRYSGLLAEVIEKAARLNSKKGLLYNSENEVRELFQNSPLVIETEHVDINERSLLGSKNREMRTTPPELLKNMKDTFEVLCSEVKEISSAAETVDSRLAEMREDIVRLNSTAKRLGIINIPILGIDNITEMERDPLKGVMELDRLVVSIEKFRARIQAVERDYRQVAETFERVRGMLLELESLRTRGKVASAEAEKIFGVNEPFSSTMDDVVLESLKDWVKVLENKLSEESINAVKIGAARLERECTAKLDLERDNFNRCCGRYSEWLDLKGQYKALEAKAQVLMAKGLLQDNLLEDLIENARNAVYTVPVNLDDCRQMVRKLNLALKR